MEKARSSGLLAANPAFEAAPAGRLGIGSGPRKQGRSTIGKLTCHRVDAPIELGHQLQQPHRLEFIHGPGLRLIAGAHGITGEAKHIAQTEGVGPQQIRLQGNPVAIPAGQLQHGLNACIEQQAAHRQAAHPHHRSAAIGHVDGMHPTLQGLSRRQGSAGIPPAGRRDFRCDGQLSAGQGLLEQQANPC